MDRIKNEVGMAGGQPEDELDLNVDIFRHGKSNYTQPYEVPISEAQDLMPEAIEKVKENAEKLAEMIEPDEEVEIWASPMGRTLHTAKIISEVLEEKGITLRKKGTGEGVEYGIKVWPELSEVKNFSWGLFEPLMNGGWVEFGENRFYVDKKLSNPKGLGYPDYFNTDAILDIPDEVKSQWPQEYVDRINSFETFKDVTGRIIKPLSRLKQLHDKKYRIIMVTHDALTGFMANVFTGGEKGGLEPGTFINLERKDDKLVATQLGEIMEGNSDVDVIDEFNKSK